MPLDRADIEGPAVDILIDEIQLNKMWVPHLIVITLYTGYNGSYVGGGKQVDGKHQQGCRELNKQQQLLTVSIPE